jgi:hypothetical protein
MFARSWSSGFGLAFALVMILDSATRYDVMSVGLSATARLASDTTAVIQSAVNCNQRRSVSISAILTQTRGRRSVTGKGDLSVNSTRSVQTLAIPVTVVEPPNGRFLQGPASLTIEASCGRDRQTRTTFVSLAI